MQREGVFKLFGNLKKAWDQGNHRLIRNSIFVYGEDVAAARNNRLPIVALESTIITHGMPYPNNLHTAIRVEDAVRKKGAVPATIGILNGQVHVGLSHEQLEVLSKADPLRTMKCSRRDLSLIISEKLNGGTTVSATMLLANLANIQIMATGGIGGVHRGAELTFDVSTDLIELGKTRVAVVCSGVKSILDIPKTLEYLETQGVPVIKIGETDAFPAFYCAETYDKIKAPYRISTSKAAASIIKTQTELGLKTGILFAVPIPPEFALDPNEMEDAISKALERAKSKCITGKAVTPFLLKELNELTTGLSLQANIALIENNAGVAAEIAVDLVEENASLSGCEKSECVLSTNRNPVVVGGAIMDTTLQVTDEEFTADGRTYACTSHESCGGVGRNVANALISLGLNGTRLISVVGNDQPGKAIIKSLGNGAQTVEQLSHTNTASCCVIVDKKGECRLVVGEMEVFNAISPQLINNYRKHVENASIIVLDGNLPLDTMRFILELASDFNIPVWYEPTDINKATKIFEAGDGWQKVLHFLSPNKNELITIAKYFGVPVPTMQSTTTSEITAIAEKLAGIVPVIISTLGSQGVLVSRQGMGNQPFYDTRGRLMRNPPVSSRLYPPTTCISTNSNETFNVSGCGDCLTAGILCGIHKNFNETNCISLALKAASLSLKSFDAVPDTLSTLRDANI